MAIDGKTASRIAREHGLDLASAAALRTLADSEEEAVEMAQDYAEADEPEKIAERIDKFGVIGG